MPRRIVRVEDMNTPDHKVIARQIVLTALDTQFYLEQIYLEYAQEPTKWIRGYANHAAYQHNAAGIVKAISIPSGVNRYFDYLCQYQGYQDSCLSDEEWAASHIDDKDYELPSEEVPKDE